MRHKILVLVLVCAVFSAGSAGAWSNPGHQIVCEIAWQRLTPQAKELIRNLRRVDSAPMRTFAESCIWADDVRARTHKDTAEYHFINSEKGSTDLDFARDCAAHDCVILAIERYAVYLSRPANSDRDRQKQAEALKFLGHFMGDLHQPLHAGYGSDRGGNALEVEWFGEQANLHRVWDSLIPSRGNLRFPSSAHRLADEITAAQAAQWESFDVLAWAQESFDHAVRSAYQKPDGSEVRRGDVLDEEYFDRALPIVKEQLQKAGVRLAFLLNTITAGEALSFPDRCGSSE